MKPCGSGPHIVFLTARSNISIVLNPPLVFVASLAFETESGGSNLQVAGDVRSALPPSLAQRPRVGTPSPLHHSKLCASSRPNVNLFGQWLFAAQLSPTLRSGCVAARRQLTVASELQARNELLERSCQGLEGKNDLLTLA
jgi:hypothetical protein